MPTLPKIFRPVARNTFIFLFGLIVWMKTNVDPDQQLHQKIAALDMHRFQNNLIGYGNLKKFNP